MYVLVVIVYEQERSGVAGMYGQISIESFLAHVFCSKMDVVEEVLNQDRQKRKITVTAVCLGLYFSEHGSAAVIRNLPNQNATAYDDTQKKSQL